MRDNEIAEKGGRRLMGDVTLGLESIYSFFLSAGWLNRLVWFGFRL